MRVDAIEPWNVGEEPQQERERLGVGWLCAHGVDAVGQVTDYSHYDGAGNRMQNLDQLYLCAGNGHADEHCEEWNCPNNVKK